MRLTARKIWDDMITMSAAFDKAAPQVELGASAEFIVGELILQWTNSCQGLHLSW